MEMKKVIFAALVASFGLAAYAQSSDPCLPNGGQLDAATAQEIENEALASFERRRSAATRIGDDAEKAFGKAPPSVQQASCFDKYSKFGIPISFGIPSIGDLIKAVQNAACSVVDQQIAKTTSGIGVNGQMPYGLGGVRVGGPVAGGTNGGYTIGSGGVTGAPSTNNTGSVANQVGNKIQGIFR